VNTRLSRGTVGEPPRLIGPADHVLELEPFRYQFHLSGTILHSPVTNDWDANWVVVRMAAADGNRRRSSTAPAFLTWDLQRLVNWLRAVADHVPDLHHGYSSLEPNLQLEIAYGDAEEVRMRAHFSQEFEPSAGNPWIDFILDRSALYRFADELHAALAPFPIRAVENDGPAKTFKQQLVLGATRWQPRA
jgi:hypothetical protein